MSTSTINKAFIAFDAITSIIAHETEQIKKSQINADFKETSDAPTTDIEAIQTAVFDKVMGKLEGYFAAFEERMNLKLDQIKPAPVDLSKVYNITDAITKTVNKIEDKLNAIEAAAEALPAEEEVAPAPAPKAPEPVVKASEPVPEPVEEESEEEEPEEEDNAEEELTDFLYKGKTYYLDSEYNVYAQDENGDLIEDPVGTYNQATRKITFN